MNKTQILGLIRHILTCAGGYIVGKGWVDEVAYAEIVGAVVTLVGLVWSVKAPEKK